MNNRSESGSRPEESRLAQRLRDAGRVAGRLAHDFDNLLMGASGFAELAQRVAAIDSPARGHIDSLLKVLQLGQASTRRLHAFSRSGQVVVRPTDCVAAWRSVWRELESQYPGVRVVEREMAGLPTVAIGIEPWKCVLTELARNAAEAMPEGGNLTLSAAVVSPIGAFETLGPLCLPAGSYVRWSMADAGSGIRPAVLARIEADLIESTKPRHRGLGLPIALRTLVVHGGGLRLEPCEPAGTAAIVYVPVAESLNPGLV